MSRKLTKEQWASIKKEQRQNRLRNFYTMETDEVVYSDEKDEEIKELIQNAYGFKVIDNQESRAQQSVFPNFVNMDINPEILNQVWKNFNVNSFTREPGELPEYFEERMLGVSRILLNEKYFDMGYDN